jgi:hypothetical protein
MPCLKDIVDLYNKGINVNCIHQLIREFSTYLMFTVLCSLQDGNVGTVFFFSHLDGVSWINVNCLVFNMFSVHSDYDHVRYLKKSRPCDDLYIFSTYFYSKLEKALSRTVCSWSFCVIFNNLQHYFYPRCYGSKPFSQASWGRLDMKSNRNKRKRKSLLRFLEKKELKGNQNKKKEKRVN